MSCTLEPAIQSGTLVSGCPFDSCQLTITWMSIRMSTIKLNTDCICLGHLASNARSLLENSQSERTYHCSHITKRHFDRPALISKWDRELLYLSNQSGKSRAGEVGPSCSLGQPIRSEYSLHLTCSRIQPYNEYNYSLWKLNLHCPFMGLNSKHFSGCCFYNIGGFVLRQVVIISFLVRKSDECSRYLDLERVASSFLVKLSWRRKHDIHLSLDFIRYHSRRLLYWSIFFFQFYNWEVLDRLA